MKPIRNKIFCVSCKRPKMLFESQAKADNFILYNKEEIEAENGKTPVRSYYCRLCGGWHVTSNTSTADAKRMDERDKALADEVEMIVKEIEEAFLSICAVSRIKELLHEINLAINGKEFNLVMSLYEECLKQINAIRGPGRKAIAKKYHKRLFGAMHRAKVAKQEMKAEPKVPTTHNELTEFDSVLDALYGKPGSSERDSFRREALEYADSMDI